MENNRGSWGSTFGFIMAAVGSAVGLGNIWGFPYKMGKCGGFAFLLIYLALAVFVGMIIMCSELALGRKTGKGVIAAYQAATKKFAWLGWLGVIAPFLIMSFYSVLGGYCIQYTALNMAELSFDLSNSLGGTAGGGAVFGAMLKAPFGAAIFTALFLGICMVIVKGGISSGIEKFNKIGMPALFVMLVIVIARALSLPGSAEGLKFMFVPGYAVQAGFIEKSPGFIEILGTAGGQMFFSLSLAMGAMVTYGSYLEKKDNIVKNAGVIVFADTLVAIMAGLAVIPAAVANGIANGTPYAEITLSGPGLLFVTLQDVFYNMGPTGPLFGIIFYLLVILAAISSAISLMEVMATHFIDKRIEAGKSPERTRVTLWVSALILIEAVLVAVDGLGKSGVFKFWGDQAWNDCFLDFMDCWSEGIAMPLGAMVMSLMIGWELKPQFMLDEIHSGENSKFFDVFYKVCIMFVVPIVMAFVLAGQLQSFFNKANPNTMYIISGVLLVIFWIIAAVGNKAKAAAK